MNKWYFYIARCADSSLYCGISNNLEKRITRHNSGHGSRWIAQHGDAVIVYNEEYNTYKDARAREAQIKKWSRIKKEKLIRGEHPSTRTNRPRSG